MKVKSGGSNTITKGVNTMKTANFLITEVRASVFAIRMVSIDEQPGRRDSISCVVRVTGIPEGTDGNSITKLLSRWPELREPPPVLPWAELNT